MGGGAHIICYSDGLTAVKGAVILGGPPHKKVILKHKGIFHLSLKVCAYALETET